MKDMETKITRRVQKLRGELNNRVGVLEKWKWVIIGGSIVCGFILQNFLFGLDFQSIIYTLFYYDVYRTKIPIIVITD